MFRDADGGDRGGAKSLRYCEGKFQRVYADVRGGQKRAAQGDLGGTMRLGAYTASVTRGSRVAEIYGATEISERHRHRYEVNTAYKARLEQRGMRFCGMSPDGILPEIIEYENHPWFIGVQFHPELKSRDRKSVV